jgi:hypothetical protein
MSLVETLGKRVVAANVKPDLPDLNALHVLVIPEPMQVARDEGLDQEQAILLKVAGHIHKASYLLILGQQVKQGIINDEDQPIDAPDGHIGEVSYGDG